MYYLEITIIIFFVFYYYNYNRLKNLNLVANFFKNILEILKI